MTGKILMNTNHAVPGNTEPKAEAMTRQEDFRGDGIEISNLRGAIRIQPSTEDKIEVSATGPNTAVASLRIGQSTNSKAVFLSGDYSFEPENRHSPPLDITIRAPVHTSVKIVDASAEIEVGDLRGRLCLDLFGTNSVHAVSAYDLDADIVGRYEVVVDEVGGTVDVECAGRGSLKLGNGIVEKLCLDVASDCCVDAQVSARRAFVNVGGTGRVHIRQVTGELVKTVYGGGHLEIG